MGFWGTQSLSQFCLGVPDRLGTTGLPSSSLVSDPRRLVVLKFMALPSQEFIDVSSFSFEPEKGQRAGFGLKKKDAVSGGLSRLHVHSGSSNGVLCPRFLCVLVQSPCGLQATGLNAGPLPGRLDVENAEMDVITTQGGSSCHLGIYTLLATTVNNYKTKLQ